MVVSFSSLPRIRAVPEVGKTRRKRILSVVVFPAPFGPEQAKDFARLHLEVQGIERPFDPRLPEPDAIFFGQPVDFDGKHSSELTDWLKRQPEPRLHPSPKFGSLHLL